MLLSLSKKFIFIHNFKAGGTSVRAALRNYEPAAVRWIHKAVYACRLQYLPYLKLFNDHITAREIKRYLPRRIFDSYFKFGFVRNPWSWQVSLYNYARKTPSHHQYRLTNSFRDFREYLHWRVSEDLGLQKDFFSDDSGNFVLDFVGKLETIDEDLKEICEAIDIPAVDSPYLNISTRNDWRAYYDRRTFDLVREHFKTDIEFFGYDADPASYGIEK